MSSSFNLDSEHNEDIPVMPELSRQPSELVAELTGTTRKQGK